MSRGGANRGQGRKPRHDQTTIKKRQFAGQRWTVGEVERWESYMATHHLTQKEFEQQAFTLLLQGE